MKSQLLHPVNGQVAVNEYTMTWGHAVVRLRRSGADWVIEDAAQTSDEHVYFPENRESHEAMMSVAAEYAKRLDELVQMRTALAEAEHATRAWLRAQVYRAEDWAAGVTGRSE